MHFSGSLSATRTHPQENVCSRLSCGVKREEEREKSRWRRNKERARQSKGTYLCCERGHVDHVPIAVSVSNRFDSSVQCRVRVSYVARVCHSYMITSYPLSIQRLSSDVTCRSIESSILFGGPCPTPAWEAVVADGIMAGHRTVTIAPERRTTEALAAVGLLASAIGTPPRCRPLVPPPMPNCANSSQAKNRQRHRLSPQRHRLSSCHRDRAMPHLRIGLIQLLNSILTVFFCLFVVIFVVRFDLWRARINHKINRQLLL